MEMDGRRVGASEEGEKKRVAMKMAGMGLR